MKILQISTLCLALSLAVPCHAEGQFSLADTVTATIKSHRGIKATQENRETAKHELEKAQSGYGPRLDLTAKGGANIIDNKTYRSSDSTHSFYGTGELGVAASQTLWNGYATRNSVGAAEANVDSMTHRVLDSATSYGYAGLVAHLNVLRTREIEKLAAENVRRHNEILNSTKSRESIGTDTMVDVNQTEARFAVAQSTHVNAIAAVEEADSTYRRLTALVIPDLQIPAHPGKILDEKTTLEIAQKCNPKILAYMADIRNAGHNTELSKSTMHPTVNLEAGAYTSDRGGNNDDRSNSAEIMATMRWNLYNSGADTAAISAARSRTRQIRQTLMDTWDEIKLETHNTWSQYVSAQKQLKHYTDATNFNVKTRDAYTEQFLMGQRSLLDVLDAEREVFNTKSQVVTIKNNILILEYKLHAISGKLLDELKIPAQLLAVKPNTESQVIFTFE